MGFRINTNVPALVSQHRLEHTTIKMNETHSKLASGSRIISAKDDASGLAISENLRAALRSTERNIMEANNGMFLLRTADGALNYITDIVIRMKELAVAASSDTNGDKERSYLNAEVQELKVELDRISRSTKFNGRPLLDGSGSEVRIQVGPSNDDNVDRIGIEADLHVDSNTLGLGGVDLSGAEGARSALDLFQDALDYIAGARGALGASESALHSTISNLMHYEENLAGAFSQIRDADIAHETATLAKLQVLNQAGVAVLAQANAAPGIALKLLNG